MVQSSQKIYIEQNSKESTTKPLTIKLLPDSDIL